MVEAPGDRPRRLRIERRHWFVRAGLFQRAVFVSFERGGGLELALGEMGNALVSDNFAIHVGDPVAFFDPLDRHNEYYLLLDGHPDWHFCGPDYPPFEQLMAELDSLLGRHPETTFIGAHVGCFPENLAWVGQALEAHPNLHVDIGARLAELGRQPYTARDFFLRYPDRILFGTDNAPAAESYAVFYRFLETRDEFFSATPRSSPGPGQWAAYGLYLPDEILEKVYRLNTERLLGA